MNLSDAVFDDAADEVIVHKAARLHDILGLDADGGLRSDSRTEHVPGAELRNAQHLLDLRALGALARSWGAEDDHDLAGPFGKAISSGLGCLQFRCESPDLADRRGKE